MHGARGPVPVGYPHPGRTLRQRRPVGRTLRTAERGAVEQRPQVAPEQVGTDLADLRIDGRAGVIERYRHGLLIDDVAGVGSRVQVHHRVSRHRFAAQDSPVHRRAATVAWQQGGVKPDDAPRRHAEQFGGQQPGPSGHDHQVRPQFPDPSDGLGGVDVSAVAHRDAVRTGQRLQVHEAGGASRALSGQRYYLGDLGLAVEQNTERRNRLMHRADKDNTLPGHQTPRELPLYRRRCSTAVAEKRPMTVSMSRADTITAGGSQILAPESSK